MPLAAASGVGCFPAEQCNIHRRAGATRQLHAQPLCSGSYFWKQHPRGLQWMLLVLAPALTWLPLSYSSTERGVIGCRRFSLSTVQARKCRFGLPGAAPAVRQSSLFRPGCKVTANLAEHYLKGHTESSHCPLSPICKR